MALTVGVGKAFTAVVKNTTIQCVYYYYHHWPNRVWLFEIRAATCALSVPREWQEIDEENTDLHRVCESNAGVRRNNNDVLYIRANEYGLYRKVPTSKKNYCR
jgi:hypothetical protein